jgi:hypothetical protein
MNIKLKKHICKYCGIETMMPDDNCWAKPETLEEAAERLYPNGCDGTDRSAEIYRRIFIEGAKWQQERMYSEEEVGNIANWAFGFYKRNDLSDSELEDEFNRILVEQFKKK